MIRINGAEWAAVEFAYLAHKVHPGRHVFEWLGADQSTMFYDPYSFAGTNGLILGIVFYSIFRAIWTRWENRRDVAPAESHRQEAKVG